MLMCVRTHVHLMHLLYQNESSMELFNQFATFRGYYQFSVVRSRVHEVFVPFYFVVLLNHR